MAAKISEFRTPADAEEFRRLYDGALIEHWPSVEYEDLTVDTAFGITSVRRSGSGTGTPIVMMHPYGGASIGLAPFIGPAAREHSVYTPDTIGTPGRSVQRKPITGAHDLAAWLEQTIDGLELDTFHLVGYSEGGYIAAVSAALTAHPDRIATVTLIEPGGVLGKVKLSTLAGMIGYGARMQFAKDKASVMNEAGEWLNGESISLPDGAIELARIGTTRFKQRVPYPRPLKDAQLSKILAPTLVLLGERSRLHDTAKIAAHALAALPNATVHVEPSGGHGFPSVDPEATMRLILEFIDGHEK